MVLNLYNALKAITTIDNFLKFQLLGELQKPPSILSVAD